MPLLDRRRLASRMGAVSALFWLATLGLLPAELRDCFDASWTDAQEANS